MQFQREFVNLVENVISEYGTFDFDFSEDSHKHRTSTYLSDHRHEYIRTVQDVVQHCGLKEGIRVLEIGAFFGVVCICLSKLGFRVTAADSPEYISKPEQQARFDHYGIDNVGVRLQDYVLPFADETFDVIIMCEVLEHLNFNPLPLIKELNRIGRPDSLLYLSLPNLTSIYNRMKLITGRSIQVSVESFFRQLDPKSPEIANGHWREYTGEEIRRILTTLGYRIERQYYFSLGECLPVSSVRRALARGLYTAFPSLKENQTTLAIRDTRTDIIFSIPKTVHPTLDTL